MEIVNAKIESTNLGFEGHGVFSFMLHLDYGGGGQGFGGYALGGEYTNQVIKGILKTLDVENWEDLPGTFVRVKREQRGKIHEIGHLLDDKWFNPQV